LNINKRESTDNLLIANYLLAVEELANTLHEGDIKFYNNLLREIAIGMKYKHYLSDSVIFREGNR